MIRGHDPMKDQLCIQGRIRRSFMLYRWAKSYLSRVKRQYSTTIQILHIIPGSLALPSRPSLLIEVSRSLAQLLRMQQELKYCAPTYLFLRTEQLT